MNEEYCNFMSSTVTLQIYQWLGLTFAFPGFSMVTYSSTNQMRCCGIVGLLRIMGIEVLRREIAEKIRFY